MNPKTISFAVGKFSYELETAYINSGWIVGLYFVLPVLYAEHYVWREMTVFSTVNKMR